MSFIENLANAHAAAIVVILRKISDLHHVGKVTLTALLTVHPIISQVY